MLYIEKLPNINTCFFDEPTTGLILLIGLLIHVSAHALSYKFPVFFFYKVVARMSRVNVVG
jgi:hypothetical protein